MDHSPVSTMVVDVWWGDDLAWFFKLTQGFGLCPKASWTLGLDFVSKTSCPTSGFDSAVEFGVRVRF